MQNYPEAGLKLIQTVTLDDCLLGLTDRARFLTFRYGHAKTHGKNNKLQTTSPAHLTIFAKKNFGKKLCYIIFYNFTFVQDQICDGS